MKQALKNHTADNTNDDFLTKARKKSAKTFAIALLTYIICWAPTTVTFFYCLNRMEEVNSEFSELKNFVYLILVTKYYYSALNPFIYACRIKDICDSFKRIFRKCCCCCCMTGEESGNVEINNHETQQTAQTIGE